RSYRETRCVVIGRLKRFWCGSPQTEESRQIMEDDITGVFWRLYIVDTAQVSRSRMNVPRMIRTWGVNIGPADLTNGSAIGYVPSQKGCHLVSHLKNLFEQLLDRRIFSSLPLALPHIPSRARPAFRSCSSLIGDQKQQTF